MNTNLQEVHGSQVNEATIRIFLVFYNFSLSEGIPSYIPNKNRQFTNRSSSNVVIRQDIIDKIGSVFVNK